uniref:BPTI/Kunitz inhibitor domain-containing protein n=1 Tax=Panagrolaimus sp. JU765 TaxID=591449 RepID=A0AC34RQV2_9BILA
MGNLTLAKAPYDPETCKLRFDSGDCLANMPVIVYDVDKKVCEEKIYGGCAGAGYYFKHMAQCFVICELSFGQNTDGQVQF